LSEGIHPILLGAAAKIPKILGSEDAPTRVRIVLSAKTKGSDGPVFLRIGRAGGKPQTHCRAEQESASGLKFRQLKQCPVEFPKLLGSEALSVFKT
jgi:hypothetical protein